ncbi:DNA-binding CsgD family transcriptional regulator [Silvibacterium bohemicum]|uniref:DNA-binding CsgD family transcriptional regulator n=1 Tax=Silvibacterium bohemicum TaxID=1577686 RepID=A0A841K014_9BACT|nr:LuxR C-terminal-related transcriptional regulator [Silvibacterium bohemicum]MBB6143574.1 DNA-binding CsgD family transcriptional regulator [Silvibacterium bohemicum]
MASISSEVDRGRTRVTDALQTLVGLTQEKLSARETGKLLEESGETILLDTEINGHRYLLVRMPPPIADMIHLSPREQEIVRMVAKGHPNKVIADVLNISSWTVCTHLRRIFAKLGVGSRAAMVARILEMRSFNDDSNALHHMR